MESLKETKERTQEIVSILKNQYPDARIELSYTNNFELLVAVILSAQCTDERVNKVTPPLFTRFKTVEEFANCEIAELERYIYSTGFYRNKAKNIKAAAQMIVENFDGKVPDEMALLLKLPGVARKTANVVMYSGFGKAVGIVVDTHVMRLSRLLRIVPKGVVEKKNAVKIEEELVKVVNEKDWGIFSHLLILHGRRVCIARRPQCGKCAINHLCPSSLV